MSMKCSAWIFATSFAGMGVEAFEKMNGAGEQAPAGVRGASRVVRLHRCIPPLAAGLVVRAMAENLRRFEGELGSWLAGEL